jgi:hypothetical protein
MIYTFQIRTNELGKDSSILIDGTLSGKLTPSTLEFDDSDFNTKRISLSKNGVRFAEEYILSITSAIGNARNLDDSKILTITKRINGVEESFEDNGELIFTASAITETTTPNPPTDCIEYSVSPLFTAVTFRYLDCNGTQRTQTTSTNIKVFAKRDSIVTTIGNAIILPSFDITIPTIPGEIPAGTGGTTPPVNPPTLFGIRASVDGADKSAIIVTANEEYELVRGANSIPNVPIGDVRIESLDTSRYLITIVEINDGVNKIEPLIAEPNESLSVTFDFNGTGDVSVNIKVEDVVQNVTPIIEPLQSQYEYNLESDTLLEVPLIGTDISEVRFFINDIDSSIIWDTNVETNTITIPKNYFDSVGTYTLRLIPSNEFGDGQSVDVIINVVRQVEVKTPDLVNINYPSLIKGPDLVGLAVDFPIEWTALNTSYVNVFYGDIKSPAFRTSESSITLNVQTIVNELKRNGFDTIETGIDEFSFQIKLIPYNESGFDLVNGMTEVLTIKFDAGDLTIVREKAIASILEGFTSQFDFTIFDDETSNYLTHTLNVGDGNNKLISNWVGDGDSLIVKLYEPLPTIIQPNQQIWISKFISSPLIETITLIGDSSEFCAPLRGPNFTIEVDNSLGYQIYEELVASGSQTSTDLVNKYGVRSDIDTTKLNIQYESGSELYFENFVNFGSAAERINNFIYKLELVQNYENRYTLLLSGSASSSISVLNESVRVDGLKNEVIRGFDGFENHLYSVSSSASYPKSGSIPLSVTASEALNWYDTTVAAASTFDKENVNYLVNNIPAFIREDFDNSDFILFLDMVGTHFDIIWAYTKNLNRSKYVTHDKLSGVSNQLVYHLLESFGWEAKRPFDTSKLWTQAFAKKVSGNSTDLYASTFEDASSEVWRRILNNLPYLLKHKGTARAMKAILSCYGVPSSMLTIMEFGGPQDPTAGGVTKFTYDDRTAAILLDGVGYVELPWKTSPQPNAVEFRFNTTTSAASTLLKVDGEWELKVTPVSGSYATLDFYVSSSGTLYSASTENIPLFKNEYNTVLVNRTVGASEEFDIYVLTTSNDRIKLSVSASVTVPTTSDWATVGVLEVGRGLVGEFDEFRLWSVPLQYSRLEEHALQPDSISGNSYTASTSDLLFRLDFEYPKDRGVDVDIKNVSINTTYGEEFATASSFVSIPTYPYQYLPYERMITATVPSLGFNYSDKIRLEDNELISDLSYKKRATKKAFDREPVDSNRLGLFLSPTKELNMDIIKSFGEFNIDNYIGNPSDDYSDTYTELNTLRSYYFQRITRNLNEYIQLVRYIDKSLFDTLVDLAPARARVSKGLLIEPHFLERSKVKRKKPTADKSGYDGAINVDDDVVTNASSHYNEGVLDASDTQTLIGSVPSFTGVIEEGNTTTLIGDTPFYDSVIDLEYDETLPSEYLVYDGVITAPDGTTAVGEYFANALNSVGNDPNSISNMGYGLYAQNGIAIITKYDANGNLVRERSKVAVIREQYTINVPQLSISGDQVSDIINVTQTRERYKVSIISGSNSFPSVGGNIVEVTPLNGYLPSHYRNVGDLSTGLKNSYYNGAKQTASTTTDGLSPVQTFTTNPNVLKVADTGRGSGEPILVVT